MCTCVLLCAHLQKSTALQLQCQQHQQQQSSSKGSSSGSAGTNISAPPPDAPGRIATFSAAMSVYSSPSPVCHHTQPRVVSVCDAWNKAYTPHLWVAVFACCLVHCHSGQATSLVQHVVHS